MVILVYIFVITLGLALGSFMSVIVERLNSKKGILFGRSECPKCLTKLKWYDLVPILSFFVLRGKCRACKTEIPVLYPIMEIAVAISFTAYYFFNSANFSLNNLYELIIIFIFLALFFFDIKYFILPDKLIFLGFIITFLYNLILQKDTILSNLFTGLVMSLFFAIVYLISKGEWMGFGDVKLVLLIGFVLGYPMAFISVVSSIWTGAIWGIILVITGKANLKTPLPFGSFMSFFVVIFIIIKDYVEILSSRL